MHPENGPPLPVDFELRIAFHVSPFCPLPVLRGCWNGVSGVSAAPTRVHCLGIAELT